MTLHDQDFDAWLDQQAKHLRSGDLDEVERDLIAEELEGLMGDRRREVSSRLTRLYHHLLKWEFQPNKRTRSWVLTIREQRRQLRLIFRSSRTLFNYGNAQLAEAYADARGDAAAETGLPLKTFPAECPYPLDQAIDDGFWPGGNV